MTLQFPIFLISADYILLSITFSKGNFIQEFLNFFLRYLNPLSMNQSDMIIMKLDRLFYELIP